MNKCDNCESQAEATDIQCDNPACNHTFCEHCVPGLCYCGEIITQPPEAQPKKKGG
jgi:hypothetical protein